MAYLLPHGLLLHIPKTGSDWVRAACQSAVRGPIQEIGAWHCDLTTVRCLLESRGLVRPVVGTFVRHPLSWYRSAWCYWRATGRFPRGDDESRVECPDFERFVRNCMDVEPAGYVSRLYERFTGPVDDAIAFIGRQEHLDDDLVRFLRSAGEAFDERKVRSVPPRNVHGQEPGSGFPGYSARLLEDVLRFERSAIARFDYRTLPAWLEKCTAD